MSVTDLLDAYYPTLFVSNHDKISARLRVLSNDTLLDSVHQFRRSISRGQRTKAGLTKLVMDDFSQQTNKLLKLSIEELYKLASPSVDRAIPPLALVCRLMHKRYGPVVAPQLLSEPTCWNPPELTEDDATSDPSVNSLRMPVGQLKSRLSKVDSSVIKIWCDLNVPPNPVPRTKTGKYSLIAERFRSHSLSLFCLSD